MSTQQKTDVDVAASGDSAGVRQAFNDYANRVRGGDVGSLPAILGLIALIIFHLLQFTVKAITTGFKATDDPYTMFVKSFSGPMSFMVIVYGIWLVSVCMHVRHAVWSSMTTLGLNTSERARGVLNAVAVAVSVLLFLGFIAAPLACAFGWIK